MRIVIIYYVSENIQPFQWMDIDWKSCDIRKCYIELSNCFRIH